MIFSKPSKSISNCLKSKFIVWNHCLKSFTWRSTWLFRFVSAVRESAVSFDGSRRVKNREAENTDELQLLEQSCDFSSWRIYSFISCDLILLSCMDFLKTLAVLFNWSTASSVSEARHIFSLHSVETVWDRRATNPYFFNHFNETRYHNVYRYPLLITGEPTKYNNKPVNSQQEKLDRKFN